MHIDLKTFFRLLWISLKLGSFPDTFLKMISRFYYLLLAIMPFINIMLNTYSLDPSARLSYLGCQEILIVDYYLMLIMMIKSLQFNRQEFITLVHKYKRIRVVPMSWHGSRLL